jgi:hypothetical protein
MKIICFFLCIIEQRDWICGDLIVVLTSSRVINYEKENMKQRLWGSWYAKLTQGQFEWKSQGIMSQVLYLSPDLSKTCNLPAIVGT